MIEMADGAASPPPPPPSITVVYYFPRFSAARRAARRTRYPFLFFPDRLYPPSSLPPPARLFALSPPSRYVAPPDFPIIPCVSPRDIARNANNVYDVTHVLDMPDSAYTRMIIPQLRKKSLPSTERKIYEYTREFSVAG